MINLRCNLLNGGRSYRTLSSRVKYRALTKSYASCFKISASFSTNTQLEKKSGGILDNFIGYDTNEASQAFTSRWLMVLPAFATHMCIGSPWAWSIMADALTRQVGFVAPAAADWTLLEAAFPLSIVFLGQGLSASVVGTWQLKVGPRKAMAAAACAFGGGLLIGSAGIYFHSLPLLYAGYGALGGIGKTALT
jgi:hypothetical protein